MHHPASHRDTRPALLAVAVAHQACVAAERAATAGDVRRARAAHRAADALAGALAALERLILADRAAALAVTSRRDPLPVPATVTPAERAWVLGWHLLAAAARVHGAASSGGRPSFGERESVEAVTLTRQALRELASLLPPERRLELRMALTPAALSLGAQVRLFAPASGGDRSHR